MAHRRWSPSACFYDALLDVWALQEYVGILEVELPHVVERERKRIWHDVNAGDEQANHYAEIAQYQLDEGTTTRLITGTALVAIWATYESVVKRIAESIRELRNVNRKLGGNKPFPDKAKEYFQKDLKFQLHPSETDWARISDLYVLRNALAHANGRLRDTRQDIARKLEQMVKTSEGIKISTDGDLIISIGFIRGAFEFIDQLLMDLVERSDQELNEASDSLATIYD